MKKSIRLGEPIIVAQSTEEPVLFGGYQDPNIRKGEDGTLYVRFNARRDSWLTFGEEEKNPVYKSIDGGESWSLAEKGQREWICAGAKLPNGDIFVSASTPYCERRPYPSYPLCPKKEG